MKTYTIFTNEHRKYEIQANSKDEVLKIIDEVDFNPKDNRIKLMDIVDFDVEIKGN